MAGMAFSLMREKLFLPGDRQNLVSVSDRKFRKLLRHVMEKSPFYRDYYGRSGIRMSNLDEITIADLPFITKETVMDNFDEMVCVKDLKLTSIEQYMEDNRDYGKWYNGKYKIIKTSGTSGKLGIFIYGKSDWNTLLSVVMNRVSSVSLKPLRKIRLAIIADTRDLHAGISMMASAPDFLYDKLVLCVHEKLNSVVEKLNRFQPDILSGYASAIYWTACEQLKGQLKIAPGQVGCSAEILSANMRETIRHAFHVNPTNMYAASESICIAASGSLCPNLHIFQDVNILECVGPDSKAAAAGQEGNAVLTNLYNYTLPLIRYKMNDRITIKEGLCGECSRPYPVIGNIAGRESETLYFKNSAGKIEPVYYSIVSLFYHKDIKLFQIIQKDHHSLDIKVIFNNKNNVPSLKKHLHNKLSDLLTHKGLKGSVQCRIESVEFIDVDDVSGKFRYVIPMGSAVKDGAV